MSAYAFWCTYSCSRFVYLATSYIPNYTCRACFDNYVDFYRCRRLLGEEADDCRLFKRYFETICPAAWTEHWDEQRAQGTFPAPL